MECINSLIPHVDAAHLPDLLARLCDVIKKGLGSSTKSGCAHVATQLAARFRADLTPHAGVLLKALLKGAVSKSAPLRREFANAIGHVVRCASPKDVNMVVNRCRKYYKVAHSTLDGRVAMLSYHRGVLSVPVAIRDRMDV
eukprot:m.1598242 g.1598242  ORF g.1598242 m.1598242 type:complete len:141 (+) comp25344_c0_seq54:247-669(+)